MRSLPFIHAVALVQGVSLTGPSAAQYPTSEYPSFEEVRQRYFNEWRVADTTAEVRFERRPSGWDVSFWRNDDLVQRDHVWEAQRRKWIRPKSGQRRPKGIHQPLPKAPLYGNLSPELYHACIYYGYHGWSLDVIEAVGTRRDLPAPILYGTARAYSDAASNRLWPNFILIKDGYTWDLPHDAPCLTPDQLAEYRGLQEQALRYFDLAYRADPALSTIVGEIKLKRDNEYMSAFLQMSIFQDEEEARRYLAPDLYDPFYRSMAHDMLTSCGPNAILFTNGDSDTYPLLYVQATEQYRPDVLVVNLSLLNTARYMHRLRKPVFHAAPFPMPVADSLWRDPLNDISILDPKADSSFDIRGLPDLLRNAPLSEYYKAPYLALPSKHLKLAGPQDTSEVRWTVESFYLLRNGLACLTMLGANAWQRPVHWGTFTSEAAFFGLEDHFALDGLTYRLTPMKSERNDVRHPGRVDGDRCYTLFANELGTVFPDTLPEGARRIAAGYIVEAGRTVDHLLDIGDTSRALDLLERWAPRVTGGNTSGIRLMLLFIEPYYRMGRTDRAGPLADELTDHMLHDPWIPAYEDPDIRQAVLTRLRDVANLNADKERATRIQAALDALDADPKY